ncbi:MAG: hypothetical protein GY816_20150 [Cytophagales bacterium]|nr:hypothetical protein [Cytophagales bacterium]
MNEIKDLKKEFRRHQAMSNAKFEYFKDWAGKISKGFGEMKEDNDLFYDSMFEIMDRLDADLNAIKARLDKANI